MAKLLKKQISDVNISENFCIFAPSLHIRGKKCKKDSSVQEPCKIKNKKQDEDITYFTTRQNEVAPLGTAAVAHPRHPYQDDSSLGSYLHLPCLSRYRHPSFAHLRHLSFCRGRYFHCSQHRLGRPLSYLRDGTTEETRPSIYLSCCQERRLSEEKGGFREGN